jgi:RNase adapter protein RapZ
MTLSMVIVTGLSGSGKSTAIRALEDQGYFCVDNMPTQLFEQLVALMLQDTSHEKLALGVDIREGPFLDAAPRLIEKLRAQHPTLRLVYFEARKEHLVRRYAETRRVHPMDHGQGVHDALLRERELLAPLRELADEILDTSGLSPHELRALVSQRLARIAPEDNLRLALVSFGFKYGLPLEADMVLDVRFVRNPYFEEHLRPLTGLHEKVKTFVLDLDEAQAFLRHALSLLQYVLAQLKKEGKRRLTLAIGCTGGQHRSVVMVQALAEAIATMNVGIDIRHRDMKDKRT